MVIRPTVLAENYSVQYAPPSAALFWGEAAALFWGEETEPFWDVGPALAWPGQLWAEAGQRYDIVVKIPSSTLKGELQALTTVFDMEDVTEYLQGVLIESTGTRLPITKNYKKILIVRPDLSDDGGDAAYIRFADYDPVLGPLAFAYNSSDQKTSNLINAQIGGY